MKRPVIVVLVLAALVGAFFAGRVTVRPVRLIEERIVKEIREVPAESIKTVTVRLPGTRERVEVPVERIREVVRDRIVPRTVERIVTRTGPVYCATKEECDRIYAAAEQRLEISAALREGTVVPVRQDNQIAHLPLAQDYPFTLRLVLSQGGVFHALDSPQFAVKPLEVRTETILPPATKPAPSRWEIRTLAGYSTMYGGLTGLEIDYRLDRWGLVQGWIRAAGEHRWGTGQQDVRLGLVVASWFNSQVYTLLSAQDNLITGVSVSRKVGRLGETEFVIRAATERVWMSNITDYRLLLTATW